ncbi:hypothetical protein [Desulfosporosinus nitroreducens]|uniref:Uncharacterized protein n=1 Tax=Desulfosporosinus nitroreducens TaxID=2018668 RepID=A0ABT8QR93_9FIRM|nr:hypothetical protein [Desulfosporosinus nitroreducens]MCO1603101.1 hypothetical protein [Desulfosporosinus nitroreducens]MDO0823871.1 hypothetical protein [Desulfosporosinus nitroreducens]
MGRAYFDGISANTLQVKLTDIYASYNLKEIIPLDGVKDKLDINRKLPVHSYSVDLKSFTQGKDKGTWVLNYRVLDSAGRSVDGAALKIIGWGSGRKMQCLILNLTIQINLVPTALTIK